MDGPRPGGRVSTSELENRAKHMRRVEAVMKLSQRAINHRACLSGCFYCLHIHKLRADFRRAPRHRFDVLKPLTTHCCVVHKLASGFKRVAIMLRFVVNEGSR